MKALPGSEETAFLGTRSGSGGGQVADGSGSYVNMSTQGLRLTGFPSNPLTSNEKPLVIGEDFANGHSHVNGPPHIP